MPERIPVSVAEKVCKEQQCRIVIIIAWDVSSRSHIVTYGISRELCRYAAKVGERLARFLHLGEMESK